MTPRREASPTVGFIDNYCQAYQNLFSHVRNYEAFKLIHLGMLSEIPRKSLPKIARAVGLKDSQGLNYFLKEADWDVEKVREVRLWLTKLLIGEREIILCLDETGDAKKGKATLKDTWFIMTNKKGKIASTIASEYSLRNWIEYAFKQVKNELRCDPASA